jgi:hypothetical protein
MNYMTSPLNMAIKLIATREYTFLVNHTKKMEVAASLKAAQKQNGGECPNISAVSRLCNVSWHFVHKIENEIDQHDRVLSAPLP